MSDTATRMSGVLVTGANRGLGLEFVRQYCAAGWRVFACCRDPAAPAARDLNVMAGSSGRLITVHRLDVTKPEQVALLVKRLSGDKVDVLINNAGVQGPHEAFGATDYGRWMALLATNVLGPMRMAEALADHVAQSDRKIIVTLSSRLGSIALATGDERHAYRVSKAAVNMAMKTVAGYLQERGIIAVAINPGWVRTDMGGADAPIDATESVTAVRALIERLTPADGGRFLHYDGSELPW